MQLRLDTNMRHLLRRMCAVAAFLEGQVAVDANGGIPELPLLFYGRALSKSDNALVAITSAAWTVSDGQGHSVALSGTSTPPTQIVSVNGVSYYLAQVPFDTRRVGATTLSAPPNSLPLLSPSPTYTRSATINGKPATFASAAQAAFAYSSADLGRIEQVDLFIETSNTEPDDAYIAWVRGIFGNASDPRAARSADPDGDGVPNEQEFAAGTYPLDRLPVLKILSFSPTPAGNVTITWQSIAGKAYTIEKSTNLQTWTALPQPVTATGTTASFTESIGGAGSKLFYRVRVAAP